MYSRDIINLLLMKTFLGLLLIIFGIGFGLYVGIWWAFIGGIVQLIQAIKTEDIIAMDIAIGIAKIFFAGSIGTVVGGAFAITGISLVK